MVQAVRQAMCRDMALGPCTFVQDGQYALKLRCKAMSSGRESCALVWRVCWARLGGDPNGLQQGPRQGPQSHVTRAPGLELLA